MEQRQLLQRIDKLQADILSVTEIWKRLKNDNTQRIEKLQWLREKDAKLDLETQNFVAQRQQLMRVHDPTIKASLHQLSLLKIEKLLKASQYDKQFLEYFNTFLDRENRSFMRIAGQSRLDNEGYINPDPIINVKPNIGEHYRGSTVGLRIDKRTYFHQVKEMMFYYWQLQWSSSQTPPKELMRSYELVDEQLAILPMMDLVIEYHQEQGTRNLDQVTLVLERQNPMVTQLNYTQQLSIRIAGGKSTEQRLDQMSASQKRHRKINPYVVFFDYFKGLTYFIDEKRVLEEDQRLSLMIEAKKEEPAEPTQEETYQHLYQLNDTHCCTLSAILITLILTFIQYSIMLQSNLVQMKSASLTKTLSLDQKYMQIETIADYWEYLMTKVGPQLFNSESGSNFFRDNNELIGVVRIRQLRVDLLSCEDYVMRHQRHSCFVKDYSIDREQKRIIGKQSNIQDEWRVYRTADELGSVYLPEGMYFTYSGNGYVKDFSRDTSLEVFQKQVDELKVNKFIGAETSAIFLSLTTYTPMYNIWLYAHLTIERNVHNLLVPNVPLILAFTPNMYEGASGNNKFVIDVIKIIMATFMSLYGIYRTRAEGWRWRYLIVEVGALDLAATIFTFASVISTMLQSRAVHDSQSLINQETYIVPINHQAKDLHNEAVLYNYTFLFQGLNLLAILLRLSILFKHNQRVNLVFATLNRGLVYALKYLVLLTPYLVGFTLCFQCVFGSRLLYFSTFLGSLSRIFMMAQGNFSTEAFQGTASVALWFYGYFYAFMVCFISAMFQAFAIESYRSVILKDGYPQKSDITISSTLVAHWLFSWIYCWFETTPVSHHTSVKSSDDPTLVHPDQEDELKGSLVDHRANPMTQD